MGAQTYKGLCGLIGSTIDHNSAKRQWPMESCVYNRKTLVERISSSEQESEPYIVTCIDGLGQSLYIGTSTGEVLHYFQLPGALQDGQDEPYIFASRQKTHSKKKRAVQKIALLENVARALIVANSSTSVFTLPEFAPASGMGSVREVNDMSVNMAEKTKAMYAPNSSETATEVQSQVMLFTKQVIRLISVQESSLSLVKNIDTRGVLYGVWSGQFVVVATQSSYELIDMENTRKVPLFPVAPTEIADSASEEIDTKSQSDQRGRAALTPHIALVTPSEFLVTSGTEVDEPAMGLVVNTDGDISRGTITWPAYPSSIAVQFPHVLAIIEKEMHIHSIEDQTLLQIIHLESPPIFCKLTGSISFSSSQLTEMLQVVDIDTMAVISLPDSLVSAQIVFYTAEKGVECLVPVARLIEICHSIDNHSIDDLEEIQDSEVLKENIAFLTLFLALRCLEDKEFDKALALWLQDCDPRIIIYIFDREAVRGLVPIWKGCVLKIEKLKERSSDPEYQSFYQAVLNSKRDQRESPRNADTRKSIDIAILRASLDDETQTLSVIDSIVDENANTDEIETLLSKRQGFHALAHLYSKKSDYAKLLKLWTDVVERQTTSQDEANAICNKITETLLIMHDSELVWMYLLWLVQNSPSLGLSFLKATHKAVAFDDKKILQALKDLGDRAEWVWKEYLRYLVVERNFSVYANDLLAILITDLIEKLGADNRSKIMSSYDAYRRVSLPKRSYYKYFEAFVNRYSALDSENDDDTFRKFGQLRMQVIDLIAAAEYDLSFAERNLREYEDVFIYEWAILYSKSCQYDKMMSKLCIALGDLETAFDLCRDHNQILELFDVLLTVDDPTVSRFGVTSLLRRYGKNMDIKMVLDKIPLDWPVDTVSDFLLQKLRGVLSSKNISLFNKALSRADSMAISRQLGMIESVKSEITDKAS